MLLAAILTMALAYAAAPASAQEDRCEGNTDEAQYEACVAQNQTYTKTYDGELPQASPEGTGTAAPTATATPAAATVALPGTGGPPLLPIAGLLLVGAGITGVVVRHR
jgi:hypothetical protein